MGAGTGPKNQTYPQAEVGKSATSRAAVRCAGTVAAGAATAMLAVGWREYGRPGWAFALAETVGVAFLATGLVAWWRRPDNRTGPLMVCGGVCWYLANLQVLPNPLAYALGYWLAYLDLVVFAHIALAYPHGRLVRRTDRWAVGGAYTAYLVLQAARYAQEGGDGPVGWQPGPVTRWADVLSGVGVAVSAFVAWSTVRRWRAASPAARRVHGPVWSGVLATAAMAAAGAVASALDLAPALRTGLALAYGMALVALPVAFLSGLLRVRLAHRRVTDLVVRLQQVTDLRRLRDLLAGALGDPTLAVGVWSDVAGGYVDAAGRSVALPASGVTYVGERLAVLVHDPALAEQRSLVDAAAAAARLALSAAAAADRAARFALDERRRIERDLHDGVQQRLLRLSWLAKRAGAMAATGGAGTAVADVLDQLVTEARDTHVQVRELAHGIHPAAVTERGLAAAVAEHTLDAPLAVRLDIPDGHWPAAVETAAFYVIMEAVVNAAKHAGADEARVRVRSRAGRLVVEVRDGGAGGADPRRGTGLRRLRERVAALGGTLTVHSPAGGGTYIVAELPCG